ncbi:hypothetical protein TcCL_Unassigned00978 [Trypanosoma cruzi]|nr:hypothetical protein TcCL_Unassigned00978 [Trypanosoma cruzi]
MTNSSIFEGWRRISCIEEVAHSVWPRAVRRRIPLRAGRQWHFGVASWMDEDPPLRVVGGAGVRCVCVVWRLRGRGGRGSLVLLVYGGSRFALCAFLLWMAEPSHARSGGVVTV